MFKFSDNQFFPHNLNIKKFWGCCLLISLYGKKPLLIISLTTWNNLLALKLDPTNVNILSDRGALCYQMEDPKKALECYEAALKVIQSCMSRQLITFTQTLILNVILVATQCVLLEVQEPDRSFHHWLLTDRKRLHACWSWKGKLFLIFDFKNVKLYNNL